MPYQERTYRHLYRQQDLMHFQLAVKETDLDIALPHWYFSPEKSQWLVKLVASYREQIENYIAAHPLFATTLQPYVVSNTAPKIVQEMASAAELAGVGPMAAVAGALAQYTGKQLAKCSPEVIVENGGDIYLLSRQKRHIGIFAGQSPFSNKIGLELAPEQMPIGICTSSGTVGHSFNFGRADAVVVLSSSVILADAVATAAANLVRHADCLQEAVEFATALPGISGALAILGDKLAVKGDIKLIPF